MRERGQLKEAGVDGKIILRWIFRNWDVVYGMDRAGSGKGQVLGTCECGNDLHVP